MSNLFICLILYSIVCCRFFFFKFKICQVTWPSCFTVDNDGRRLMLDWWCSFKSYFCCSGCSCPRPMTMAVAIFTYLFEHCLINREMGESDANERRRENISNMCYQLLKIYFYCFLKGFSYIGFVCIGIMQHQLLM